MKDRQKKSERNSSSVEPPRNLGRERLDTESRGQTASASEGVLDRGSEIEARQRSQDFDRAHNSRMR